MNHESVAPPSGEHANTTWREGVEADREEGYDEMDKPASNNVHIDTTKLEIVQYLKDFDR